MLKFLSNFESIFKNFVISKQMAMVDEVTIHAKATGIVRVEWTIDFILIFLQTSSLKTFLGSLRNKADLTPGPLATTLQALYQKK